MVNKTPCTGRTVVHGGKNRCVRGKTMSPNGFAVHWGKTLCAGEELLCMVKKIFLRCPLDKSLCLCYNAHCPVNL